MQWPVTWQIPDLLPDSWGVSAYLRCGVYMEKVKPGQTVYDAIWRRRSLWKVNPATCKVYLDRQPIQLVHVILPGEVIEIY